MKCPFCQEKLWQDGYQKLGIAGWQFDYSCNSISCMINNDFPRYKCSIGPDKMYNQEYGLGTFYVKVDTTGSTIYLLKGYMLVDGVSLPRPFWLNFTNMAETLDKLKLIAIFS
jgi:hypothetical protein